MCADAGVAAGEEEAGDVGKEDEAEVEADDKEEAAAAPPCVRHDCVCRAVSSWACKERWCSLRSIPKAGGEALGGGTKSEREGRTEGLIMVHPMAKSSLLVHRFDNGWCITESSVIKRQCQTL